MHIESTIWEECQVVGPGIMQGEPHQQSNLQLTFEGRLRC